MAAVHVHGAESEARRLRADLAAQNDRSDLMLAIVYPPSERVAEDAELVAVEAELQKVRGGGSGGKSA